MWREGRMKTCDPAYDPELERLLEKVCGELRAEDDGCMVVKEAIEPGGGVEGPGSSRD